MRLPTPSSPGAAARRSLLFDVLAALAIAALAILLAGGIGVVGFFAVLVGLVLAVSFIVEGCIKAIRRTRRRRPNARPT